MANKFEIPEEVEMRIRHRDTSCVYCHKKMIYPCISGEERDWATIEHLREKKPFYWKDGLLEEWLAICCGSCNSSRGKKSLPDWFKSPYCTEKGISADSVAKPVRDYLRNLNTRGKRK